MRLVALTPAHVGSKEIVRRQARYLGFAGERLAITVRDQPDRPDIPHSFDTPELVASADRCVLEQAAALDLLPGDVVVPDCVLDTALEGIEARGMPAQGIMRLTVSMLDGLGLTFGAVARNRAIGNALDARIRGYDHSGRYVGVAVMDLPSEAVADTPRWNAALAAHVTELAGCGAQAVINGCSAVDVAAGPFAATVLDPTQLMVRSLALASDLGLLDTLVSDAHAHQDTTHLGGTR